MRPDETGATLTRLEARLSVVEDRLAALEADRAPADGAPADRTPPGAETTATAGATASPVLAAAAPATAPAGGPSAAADAAPHTPSDVAPPPWSLYLTLLGTVCFALIGALVLRVAAQQRWLDAAAGTALGLAYSAALLGVPAVALRREAARGIGAALQLCGALLAPLVVLEMYHRESVTPATVAMALLLGVGLVAAALGALSRRRGLATVGLLVPVVGALGLGLRPEAVTLRALAPLACFGLALIVARWRGWDFLRGLVGVVAAVVLSVGIVLTARRESVAIGDGDRVVLAAVLLWALVVVDALLRRRRLELAGAVGLALATLWAFGVAYLGRPEVVRPIGVPIAAALLVGAGVLVWRGEAMRRFTSGLLASGVLLAVVTFPGVDPSGLLLGFAALLVVAAWWKLESRFVGGLSLVPTLAATVSVIAAGGLFRVPAGAPLPRALAGVVLAAILYGHARALGGRRLAGRGAALWRWLCLIPLAVGTVVLFGALRTGLSEAVGVGPGLRLAETVTLSVLALLALALAWVWRIAALRVFGLVGVGALAAKVLLVDLLALDGGHLLGAVACLGAASVGASLLLRLSGRPAGARG